ncbi:hypothetical protein HU200_053579 [Digitaria exilis]|uniref:Uncharacterized protein n=1 Tax=Digitaria exilis TaxID=1010633 RepID=A0A835E4Y6_9POAL|nr:hypothetical protein HU200_053579 [Digitaria exilis]
MVGLATVCWALWKARNCICFEKKKVDRSPTDTICIVSSFLSYWTDLQKDEDKKDINAAALQFHPQEASMDLRHRDGSPAVTPSHKKGKVMSCVCDVKCAL